MLESYASALNDERFSHETFLYKTWFVICFSRWLHRHDIGLKDVTRRAGERFLRDWSPRRPGAPAALTHFLAWMHSEGIIASQALRVRETSELDALIEEYSSYLLADRGLASTSTAVYVAYARRFLERTRAIGRRALKAITASDIRAFVTDEARRYRTSKAASLLAVTVRSFLRFAHYRGYIDRSLVAAVPAVAQWSMASIPRALPAKAVRRVMAESKCRHTPCGLRDRAILLLLSRLGLRAREVMLLSLDDIDWSNACIYVCGKGRRERPLPLPRDVGAAIARYLREGRPISSCRRVFLRDRAPWRGLNRSCSISAIVLRALGRTAVQSASHGAHQFRHALATGMLHRGASLTEISQVLRHRDPNTTRLYAKVDLDSLRAVALPWPGRPL
ncbi:MAG: tyrosine-type recombinase/integrase [Steroidobacteraceae bacterium]